MSSQIHQSDNDEMRPEYDFSKGVRGKHHQAYRAGTNVVFLERGGHARLAAERRSLDR